MSSGDEGGRDDAVRQVRVVLEADPDTDPEAAERLARQLRAEIGELDVDSVVSMPGSAPPEGAKGADPVSVGALLVALSTSGGVFTALVETLRDWLNRHGERHRISVTIGGDTIALERATADERRELVDAYIRRHSGG
jgi:Effector Associated Constant Component 1